MNPFTINPLHLFAIFLTVFTISGCTRRSTQALPGKITGIIAINPKLSGSLKPTDVLYIIARAQQNGPPSAVKRFPRPVFPLEYSIGAEDAMIPGMGVDFSKPIPITVAARISRTGNAIGRTGDLEGVFEKNPAHPGDAGVDIMIDKERL